METDMVSLLQKLYKIKIPARYLNLASEGELKWAFCCAVKVPISVSFQHVVSYLYV